MSAASLKPRRNGGVSPRGTPVGPLRTGGYGPARISGGALDTPPVFDGTSITLDWPQGVNMRRMVLVLSAVIGSYACGAKEPPAVPRWDLDVRPLLRGSCSHCHGATVKPPATPTTRYDICSSAPFNAAFSAEGLAILGKDPAGMPILGGASVMAGQLVAQTGTAVPDTLRMPPPPAGPLYEYEQKLLQKWQTAGGASCDKERPNGKPTVRIVKAPTLEMGKVVVTLQAGDPDDDEIFGYVKLGNADLQVIPGAGRRTFTFEGVQPGDNLVIKLHDGYEAGP
jgi:hypothetical protein